MHNEGNNSMFSPQYNQEHRNATGHPALNESPPFQIQRASNEDPLEEGEDNSGPDSSTIDNFLLSALDDSVHRLFVLKLEKEFLRFAMEPMMRMLEFPGMAPFPRLVIHRVAGYFRLARSVRGTSGSWRRPIVVYKTPESYIPALRLSDLLVKEKEPVRQMKILTRASSRNGNSNETKQHSPNPPSTQAQAAPPIRLMKRERRPVIVSDAPIAKPPTPPLESETLNQREQAYALARARIFNEPLDQSLGQASLEEDPAPVQVPPSTTSLPRVDKEPTLLQSTGPSISTVQPVITPHQTVPSAGNVACTSPLGVTESGPAHPPSSSGWNPLGRPYSPPFFEFQPSYTNAPSHETNYVPPHQPPRQPPLYSQQHLQGQYHPPQSGVHPSMYHPQPPAYHYGPPDMRHDPYANRRTPPPPPPHQGLMYDYSDMNSIPGPTEKEVHLPKHIVELSNLPTDLRSLDDPRLLSAFQGHDASIRILSHAKSPDSPAVMVAVFKSNSSATKAIQHINSPHFQLIPWTGKME